MPYRFRFLPPTEYSRLDAIPHWEFKPSPDHSLILIAEDKDGNIIGTWGAIEHITMEGLWVDAKYRGSPLPVRMVETMTRELQSRGVPGVSAIISNPDVLDQAHRLGFVDSPGTATFLRF